MFCYSQAMSKVQISSAQMWDILAEMSQNDILPLERVDPWVLYYSLFVDSQHYFTGLFSKEEAGDALYWAYCRGISGKLLREWVAEYARRDADPLQLVVPVRCRWGLKNEIVQLEIFNIRDIKSLYDTMLMSLRIAHGDEVADFPRKALHIRRGDVPDLHITYLWRGEVRRGKFRPVDVWASGGFAATFCGGHVKDKELIVKKISLVGRAPRRLPTWQAVLLRIWEIFFPPPSARKKC